MLSKQQIESLKQENPDEICSLIRGCQSDSQLLSILKYLGRLPEGFDGSCLTPYLKHQRSDIRYWAVKNLGKVKSSTYLDEIYEMTQEETDSSVRREAVSSIGRMRSKDAVPYLVKLLKDQDPKVALQAVRGLLVFKTDENVRELLKQTLKDHPNEMLRSVFMKEFDAEFRTVRETHPHPYVRKSVSNIAIRADVMELLPHVPDDTVHLTFTSPPYYNARDYSIYESYEQYLDFLTDVFQQVHRITKEGRFFILNTSPVIVPRISRDYASKRYPIPFDIHGRLTEIGWEFIDDIIWAKPEASVKNRNAGFLQHRKPLGYKPNPTTEYLMVYRKQTTKLIDWNMRQYAHEIIEESKVTGDYATSNVWYIDPATDRIHPAVFPYQLCHNVVRYYSYVNDVIFDPFAGSGTLGEAAYDLKRHFFLVEQQPEYFERLQQRLQGGRILNHDPKRFFLNLHAYLEWSTSHAD